MSEKLLTPLAAFGPDLVIISAGFDAHAHDPLEAPQCRFSRPLAPALPPPGPSKSEDESCLLIFIILI